MHSRIFGIVKSEDFDESYAKGSLYLDLENEDKFLDDWDYIDHSNVDEDFSWLVETLDLAFVDYDCASRMIIFREGFKEKYFEKNFNKLKKFFDDPDALAKFSGAFSCGDMTFDLRDAIESHYEFYVSDECGYAITFDEFVRCVEYDTPYIVFDSVDYHF